MQNARHARVTNFTRLLECNPMKLNKRKVHFMNPFKSKARDSRWWRCSAKARFTSIDSKSKEMNWIKFIPRCQWQILLAEMSRNRFLVLLFIGCLTSIVNCKWKWKFPKNGTSISDDEVFAFWTDFQRPIGTYLYTLSSLLKSSEITKAGS